MTQGTKTKNNNVIKTKREKKLRHLRMKETGKEKKHSEKNMRDTMTKGTKIRKTSLIKVVIPKKQTQRR